MLQQSPAPELESRVPEGDSTVLETVALTLREHQATVGDWPYGHFAVELHRWVEILDREFKLALPSYPVLKFARIRNAYATYAWFRSEVGTKDNICFNTAELDREPALLIRTLLHELIHLWQHYDGKKQPKGRYHNREFRDKALGCGLIVDARGCTNGHTERFIAVLIRYGVRIPPALAHSSQPEAGRYGSVGHNQKMKKWTCGCTNVRCAVALEAACLKCDRPFQLA